MADEMQSPFQLGNWLVQPDLNRLSKGREGVQLEPKSMEVLIYLCRRPQQVVSADEIIKAVWNDRPMGDNPVYKSVAKLRQALGDDSSERRYIATVPKKGYRLIANVEAASKYNAATRAAALKSPFLWKSLPIVAGVVVGIVIAAAVFWKPPADQPILHSLSDFSGSHSQPSLSPDGSAVAFVNDVDGLPKIWVLRFDKATPHQLTTGDRGDSRPRWSPDGRIVLFGRAGSLWTVPSKGGDATEIVREAYNPNWSRDGERIVFERRYHVWVANADGGEQLRVTGVPERELALAPRWPAFSPDGSEIVFMDSDATPIADLWRVAIDHGEPSRLTFDPAIGSAPVWSVDGKYIYYSSQRGGSRTLWRVGVADKISTAILTGSGDDDFPDVSADGRRLVYSNSRERFAMVLSNPDTGEQRELHESRQMILAPELSADKETVAYFAATRAGGMQLFTLPLSGGALTQVTSDPLATHAMPRWSSDGKTLYFYRSDTRTTFSKVSASGGDTETVVAGWDWNVANGASVAPDGSRVIYSRLTGQAPVQTLIRDLASNSDQAFYATLEYPRWTRDGTSVIGSLHVDQRFPGDIALCPIAGSECRVYARDARIPVLSGDQSQLYFVRGVGRSQELFTKAIDDDSAEQRLMTMAPLFPLGPFYDVSNDGEIVWVRYEKQPSEIWLADVPDD